MSLVRQQSSTNFNTLSVTFNDSILSLKQQSVPYEQGTRLNFVGLLSGIVDTKVSNYSNLLISGKSLDTDVFEYSVIPDSITTIPLYIAINANPIVTDYSRYMTFDSVNTLTLSSVTDNSLSFNVLSGITDFTRCIFELEILSTDYCRIKHTDNNINYYLNYDGLAPTEYNTNFYFKPGNTTIYFTSTSIGLNDVFQYRVDIENNLLLLKKYIASKLYSVCGYLPALTALGNTLSAVKSLSAGPFTTTNLFTVSYPVLSLIPKLNSSWVSYNTTNINQGKINTSKSLFDIADNNLIHNEYNNIDNTVGVKIVKLKSNISDKNFTKRSTYLSTLTSISQANTPTPYFRDYTSISTGIGGEHGNDDITLSYVFYDHDYIIKNGGVTPFTTPATLFPYDQININDTTFVRDGAFGCSAPFISDKVYRTDGINSKQQSGSYLTTWLSATNVGDYGVWMDRYYYPDLLTRQAAMSSSAIYDPSFNDPISTSIYTSTSNFNAVVSNPFFDKVSDLVIQPSTDYVYERVDSKILKDVITSFKGLIYTNFSQYITLRGNEISHTTDTIDFVNDKYVIYETDEINRTGSMVLKFDLTNNWYINSFNTLFGTNVDRGFSITNDEKITPFTFINSNSAVGVYNSNQSLIYSLSFSSAVKDIIIGDHLKDYYVTYGNLLARVSSSGQIKNVCSSNALSSYINFTLKDDSVLTFLLGTGGECISFDLNSFATTALTATRFTTNILSSYPVNSIKYIDDVCYGFYGNKVLLTDGDFVFHQYGNLEIYREQLSTRIRTPNSVFCSSSSTMYDFNVDNNGNLVILHDNGSKITKVDQYKTVVDTYTLDVSGNFLIDFVSEYTLSGYKFEPILLGTDSTTNLLQITRLDKDYNILSTSKTGLSGGYISDTNNIKSLTNYNQFIRNTSADYLNFSIVLKNYYNDTDRFTHTLSIPTQDLRDGIQSFVVCLDQTNGAYKLYNNGIQIDSVSFDSNKYRPYQVFKTHFILGATGFHNEQTLGDFTLQPSNYVANNVSVSNLKIYNTDLEEYKIQALMLEGTQIDDLNISLPCGQRNNIEEINKWFKFAPPNSNSNNINIVVKNVGDISDSAKESIKDNLLLSIDNILPGDVNINSIRFENYR